MDVDGAGIVFGSEVPVEKLTVSGSGPSVLSALRTATGARRPLTYCHLYIPASALMLKNPSPGPNWSDG